MDAERWQRVRQLLEEVLELDPDQRAAHLRANGADVRDRAAVESLVEAHDKARSFLEVDQTVVGERPAAPDRTRFLPGRVLARRYRIVSLLGRGGMGEVYRADDLRLGQTVALKFLPPGLEHDAGRLERFRNEVKLARRVTHANVCRIHDLDEVEEQHFISMEYVDGEDLASLLRRIGRLPRDKAVQIARQLCAGLAAVHGSGLLHRDIKPENVLLDGRGHVRITDFGLAAVAAGIEGSEIHAGTPHYMSPEQMDGKEVTTRSDLYSLGLVLYELFTGRRAFEAGGLSELMRLRAETTPLPPSSLVEGLDESVERVILRCLEYEPCQRPPSVLAVCAALPGGDLLAVAAAAGETPSPEVVAEVGGIGAPPLWVVWSCLCGILVSLSGVLLVAKRYPMWPLAGSKAPEYLEERAGEILLGLGYPGPHADRADGFQFNSDYLWHLRETETSPEFWRKLAGEQPSGLLYWHRRSPLYLAGGGDGVSYDHPPPLEPGMVGLRLDAQGRLVGFEAIPPDFDETAGPHDEPSWAPVFEAAGFDLAEFEPAEPAWSPSHYADRRFAWKGTYPLAPEIPIRVEAAAYRGKPVSFRIVEPWTWSFTLDTDDEAPWTLFYDLYGIVVSSVILLGGAFLARRNLRRGRSDRRSAFRLSLIVFAAWLLALLLNAHHVPDASEWTVFIESLGWAWLYAGLVWMLYVGLEPYLRRSWPRILVSWVRLLHGRARDPLVGRDLLIGTLCGCVIAWIRQLYHLGRAWSGLPVDTTGLRHQTMELYLLFVENIRQTLAGLSYTLYHALYGTLSWLVLLLLLSVALRKRWIAVCAIFLIGLGAYAGDVLDLPCSAVSVLLALTVLLRFGALPFGALLFTAFVINSPLRSTLHTAWSADSFALILSLLLGMTFYGFHTALAGRPALGERALRS